MYGEDLLEIECSEKTSVDMIFNQIFQTDSGGLAGRAKGKRDQGILGRGNSKCKASKARMHLACVKSRGVSVLSMLEA